MNRFVNLSTISLAMLTSIVRADTNEEPLIAADRPQRPSYVTRRPPHPKDPRGLSARLANRENMLCLTADVLLWQAHAEGTTFALEASAEQAGLPLPSGDKKHPDFSFDWGFKVGLGYDLPNGNWGLYAEYTRVHFNAHKHAIAPNGGQLTDELTERSTPLNPARIRDGWHFHYNNIDLRLGRAYKLNEWVSIQPTCGLRSQWINQHQKNLDTGGNVPGDFYVVQISDRFYGLGVVGGLDTHWSIGNCLSVFGNTGLSIAYGFSDQPRLEYSSTNGETTTQAVRHDSFRTSKVTTDLQLGLAWDTSTLTEDVHFGIKAGWEHHVFINQVFGQKDLSIQGATVAFRLDF